MPNDNYEQQLKTLIDIVGYEKIVNHIIVNADSQVAVGMALCHDCDGTLSPEWESLIRNNG